jgi:hypothetical protein
MAYFFSGQGSRLGYLYLLCASLSGCAFIAESMTPQKEVTPSSERHTLEEAFWKVFKRGDYEHLDPLLNRLKLDYLKNPKDPLIASKIGFLHAWRVTERARRQHPKPDLTDDLTLAARYFEAAHLLEPENPVTHGFYAAFLLADGTIHDNKKKTTAAWFKAQQAIKAWPEFNQFTVAYLLNALPFEPKKSQMGIDLLDDVMQRCLGEAPELEPLKLAAQLDKPHRESRLLRACGNSAKAPFNIQGFLLNMGDMLVRHGDIHRAGHTYRTLRATKDFPLWPYNNVVTDRVEQMKFNAERFRETLPFENPDVGMMFTSKYACMACHQAK